MFFTFQLPQFNPVLPDNFRPLLTSSPIPFDEESTYESNVTTSSGETIDYLYCGASVSVNDFKENFNAITSKHRLSNAAKSDILDLITKILPVPNKCPTLHKMTEKELPYKKYDTNDGQIFILSLEKQMMNIFKRFPDCHTLRQCQHSEVTYCDIPDGQCFPDITPNTIYLLMNTDGLSPILSARTQVWPIIFSIINLPIPERRKASNLILAGELLLFYHV